MKKLTSFPALTALAIALATPVYVAAQSPANQSSYAQSNMAIQATVTGGYSIPTQKSNDGGSVTITRLPTTVEEFKVLRQQIADEPHGAAAAFVVALQMYLEDAEVGEECLAMSVTPSQRNTGNPKKLASVGQIIRHRYHPSNTGSSVYSPWIPYSVVEGFELSQDWQKPEPPYQMFFGHNPGRDNMDQSGSSSFEGYAIPMTIDAFNNTTSERSRYRNVTAVKVKGETQYVLSDFDNLISTASYKRP
ncbi:MAG: hypothetical protein Q4G44_02605 [Alcaligenaceae bacterium]|nr:hypothetical protein [Alcaligenaceae bacterium]